MGFSEMEMRCKRHPNEIQQPGICSSCLREKLALVSSSSASFYDSKNTNNTVFCSSYSSASYSSVSSSPSTPRRLHGGSHRRNGSDVMCAASFMLSGGDLKKSKSIGFVRRDGGGEGDGGRKRGGFWKKLLKNTGRRTKEVLMNSRSLRGDMSLRGDR